METTWDKLRAVVFALGLHTVVIGLLLVGLLSQQVPVSADAKGSIIEATLVSSPQPSEAVAKAIQAIEQKATQETVQHTTPPSLPKPEPKPLDAPPRQQLASQAPLPRPDTVDKDELRRLADQAPQKKLRELAQDNPPASIGTMHPPTGNNGDDMAELLERYRAALHTTANANWDPAGVPSGVHCTVRFTQIPGGEVIAINYQDCPLDATARESIERAMHKDSMPYAGFEAVFSRQATIDFCYPEESCAVGAR